MAARPSPPSGRGPTRAEIASYLEENALLLEVILEKQNTGRLLRPKIAFQRRACAGCRFEDLSLKFFA